VLADRWFHDLTSGNRHFNAVLALDALVKRSL
jgi:hypothetical protein